MQKIELELKTLADKLQRTVIRAFLAPKTANTVCPQNRDCALCVMLQVAAVRNCHYARRWSRSRSWRCSCGRPRRWWWRCRGSWWK